MQHIVLVAIATTIAIFGLWIAWAIDGTDIANWWASSGDLSKAATWGSSFGAFTALFGALGFAAVIATLLIQGRALKKQQDDLHKQQFDRTFFQLLQLMREVRSEIRFSYSLKYLDVQDIRDENPIVRGKRAILFAVREIRFWILNNNAEVDNLSETLLVKIYQDYVHSRYESDFGPYFRLIYTILYRIKTDEVLSAESKIEYSNLLRSQLESHEIFLLGVNGLSPVSKDLDKFIVEFHMLKYLPDGVRRSTLQKFYAEQAFAARDDEGEAVLTATTAAADQRPEK